MLFAVVKLWQSCPWCLCSWGLIIGYGMFAFRDPVGIRPLMLGKREIEGGRIEYMVASESVA